MKTSRISFLLLLCTATFLNAAVPTFRAASSALAHSTTAVTPAAPSGLATGDFEILVAGTELGQTLSITTAGGSSWTAISGTPVNGTTSQGEILYVWWRVNQSGDSSPTVTASGDHAIAFRMAIQTGTFDSVSPIEIQNTGSEDVQDTSYSYAPGTTTLGPDRLVFAIASDAVDTNSSCITAAVNATLANVANTIYANVADGGGGGLSACRGELATAGSVGTFSATWITGNSRKNYCSFAVKPVATTATNPGGFFRMF